MKNFFSFLIPHVFYLFSLFSLRGAHLVGQFLGKCLWLMNGRTRKITEKNLEICFTDMSHNARKDLAQESLLQLGMMTIELGASWFWPVDKLFKTITEVDGLECLDQAHKQGKGVVILAPHLGNWEILGLYLAEKYAMTGLYQPPAYTSMDKMMYEARSRNGIKLVPTNTSGVKALLKALRRGEVTMILPDQVPPKKSGDFAPFFGIPTLTATLAQNLISRTQAAVVVAGLLRLEDNSGFRLVIRPVAEEIYSPDTRTALTALNKGVEEVIMESPAQYQWEYKRFRRAPPGAAQPYK